MADQTLDLVARLNAAIDKVEKVARDASGDWEREGPATGEHWQWVRSGHYDPLIDQRVDMDAEDPADEFIADGNPVSLRSVEEYPTQSVGPLPHFVVIGEGETARAPARHIVLHDPAAVLRLCQAHRDLIACITGIRHSVIEDGGWFTCPAATEEREGETTWREDVGTACDCGRDTLVAGLLGDLARGYGLEDQ